MQFIHLVSRSMSLKRGQTGQALVEYSLILGLIAIASIIGLVALNGGVDSLYGQVETAGNCMANVLNGDPCT